VLTEELMELAALAGNTVVVAATTDAWETSRKGFARLLGRGDPDRTKVAERRLKETCQQLTGPTGAELEQARGALVERWTGRLADLLEENPAAEADLRVLVQQIQAQVPAGMVSAADRAVAAGRDVNINATSGGVAGVIYGNVTVQGPTGDRYTKAVKQLRSDKLEVRIDGIDALDRSYGS
jgi:hypothetical protein